ncbi:hypothetical protein PoB_002678400 [Plakobranchus ocellatus]|uniref:Uncharacterized protein n=1 Tax=Plakobranchus ocellatus TaxID=259542 RepID=A0AAV4A116_9GAST|nr:hypothetical protein PoB_002678400 [Plakobranchus ocellatus]
MLKEKKVIMKTYISLTTRVSCKENLCLGITAPIVVYDNKYNVSLTIQPFFPAYGYSVAHGRSSHAESWLPLNKLVILIPNLRRILTGVGLSCS